MDPDAVVASDKYFDYAEVAPGIIVGIAKPNRRVVSNVAFIDLGDEILVIDAQSRPSAAQAAIQFSLAHFTAPVTRLLNTHHHWDHTNGNAAYRDFNPTMPIIAHRNAVEAVRSINPEVIRGQLSALPAEIDATSRSLCAARSPAEAARLKTELDQLVGYGREISELRIVVPDVSVETSLRLAGSRRSVIVRYLGPAHTNGDLFVELEDDGYLVTGDCVVGWTPSMGDADPVSWIQVLDRAANGPSDLLLMGHGRPRGRQWLEVFRQYLYDLVAETRAAAAPGTPAEQVGAIVRTRLAARYETVLEEEVGDYRPWGELMLANVQRVLSLMELGRLGR